MNPRKVDEYDYIQFLLAAKRVFSTVEAAKVVSGEEHAVAHDAFTRLLQRLPPDSAAKLDPPKSPKRSGAGLVVDTNTVETCQITFQTFQTIPWW